MERKASLILLAAALFACAFDLKLLFGPRGLQGRFALGEISAKFFGGEPEIFDDAGKIFFGLRGIDQLALGAGMVLLAFFKLGLIPKPVNVADIVWRPVARS
jgi:hypothetical protein